MGKSLKKSVDFRIIFYTNQISDNLIFRFLNKKMQKKVIVFSMLALSVLL
jgi:hypothetical protein